MAKIVCPYCFNEFKRSDVMFRCTNDGCQAEIDQSMKEFWGQDRKMLPAFGNSLGSLARMLDKMPDSAVCPHCSHTSYTVICPHCHNVIPKEMVEHKGYIISIIGARGSGKTNYITVLIDQLCRNGNKLGNLGVLASAVADDRRDCTQVRYQTDFYDVLFRKGILPAQTKINDTKSKIPLIYTISQKGMKMPLYLVFYDTAGENFNDPKNIVKNARFLDESDAMIFLLDTFGIEKVQETLGLSKAESDYGLILNNIVFHFKQGDKRKKDIHFKKPLALAFSKIDAVLEHRDKFESMGVAIPGMSMAQDSPYLDGGGVRMDDIDAVSDGIMAALKSWGENNFVNNITSNYRNFKFFGFSALGSQPDSNNHINSIRPYRVLDPLVWILDQLGYPLMKSK